MKSLRDIERLALSVSGWLTLHEGKFLYKAASRLRNHEGTIVEIGSYCGKSTLWLAASGQGVYAIDPHKGRVSGGRFRSTYKTFVRNLTRAGLRSLVTPIVKTSHVASKTWKNPIKLLFIDGLHDELHAQEDYALWNNYVADGGIIAMHDAFCGWEGAGDVALRYIVRNNRYKNIGVVGSIVYGIKGKSDGVSRIKRLFDRWIIALCNDIYRSKNISKSTQFVLIHKFLRVFLINQFTSF